MVDERDDNLFQNAVSSCITAELFENGSACIVGRGDTQKNLRSQNESHGSSKLHQIEEEDDNNLLDKTVVSINGEELDSLEKLNISNVDGKDFEVIEGCKDAITFTSSCPIGKWFSDLGSNITVSNCIKSKKKLIRIY